MNNFGMKIASGLTVCLLGLVSLAQPGRLMAQAAPATASIHGHVQDPVGIPLANGTVQLSTDRSQNPTTWKYEFSFPIDAHGDYTGTGIKPGTYHAVAFNKQGVFADSQVLPLAAGDDKTADFDMTRQAYIDKMSPAEKEQMEETKKANAEAMAKNSKIENLNKMLIQARTDTAAGNYASAIKAMTEATTAKPDAVVLWVALGNAQLGEAGADEKTAKAAKATDASIPGKLTVAIASYRKALDLNAALSKPDTSTMAAVNNQLGVALGKLAIDGDVSKRADYTKDAIAAYEAAATADPKGAEQYYMNEAKMLYNLSLTTGNSIGLVEVADKIITVDPTRADGYYFKSQGLAPSITVAADGKIVAPAGLEDACKKYLELAPNGPYAADEKGLLAGINAAPVAVPVYKEPKKKK